VLAPPPGQHLREARPVLTGRVFPALSNDGRNLNLRPSCFTENRDLPPGRWYLRRKPPIDPQPRWRLSHSKWLSRRLIREPKGTKTGESDVTGETFGAPHAKRIGEIGYLVTYAAKVDRPERAVAYGNGDGAADSRGTARLDNAPFQNKLWL
jgi:hypothetical protein